MTIEKRQSGDKLEIAVSGRLDTNTAPQLEEAIKNSIGTSRELVFDFKELAYIASAGLRVLLFAQKVMNRQGSMSILHAGEDVMDVFKITGFIDILHIERENKEKGNGKVDGEENGGERVLL